MNPEDIPKGPSAESNGMGGNAKPKNQPGVYRHEKSGKEIIVLPDPQGTGHADALVRFGFERVGDAPSRVELRKMQADQHKKDMEDAKNGALDLPNVIQPDEGTPVHNGTATDVTAERDAALARAQAAETELARLRGEQSAKAKPAKAKSDQTNEEGK